MVNRDADLSAVEVGDTTYFVVPEPLADDWADYCKNHDGFYRIGEVGSHVKWDYTEWCGPARIADDGLEFLYQMLMVMDAAE